MSGDETMMLVLNAGSSSVKYSVFSLPDFERVFTAKIERIGEPDTGFLNFQDAFKKVIQDIRPFSVSLAAHRIVHGGSDYTKPVLLSEDVVCDLERYIPLAPLHQPHNLEAVRVLAQLWPNLPQYGDFDTSFHAAHDDLYNAYALPLSIRTLGVRRYGFHGISYRYLADVLKRDHGELAKDNVVLCHLGNGSSLCALKNGVSIDTTMGMTALDGLPMGTRCGSVDPGALLFLLNQGYFSSPRLEKLLYEESGLLGLSGLSNDVRTLLQSERPDAAYALDFYCHKVAQGIAAMGSSLGGIDAVVFSGGIGENAEPLRKNILQRLDWLPHFETLVIPTQEELSLAQEVYKSVPHGN